MLAWIRIVSSATLCYWCCRSKAAGIFISASPPVNEFDSSFRRQETVSVYSDLAFLGFLISFFGDFPLDIRTPYVVSSTDMSWLPFLVVWVGCLE